MKRVRGEQISNAVTGYMKRRQFLVSGGYISDLFDENCGRCLQTCKSCTCDSQFEYVIIKPVICCCVLQYNRQVFRLVLNLGHFAQPKLMVVLLQLPLTASY